MLPRYFCYMQWMLHSPWTNRSIQLPFQLYEFLWRLLGIQTDDNLIAVRGYVTLSLNITCCHEIMTAGLELRQVRYPSHCHITQTLGTPVK
jgi:hypothetical protein